MSSTYKNVPLATVTIGMTIESVYYLCEASEKQTKGGKPYCDLKLRDKTGARIAKYWNALEGFSTCSYVYIKEYSQDYNGTPNIIVQEVINIDESETDIEDFMVTVDNINDYKATFEDAQKEINNPTLKALFGIIFSGKTKELFFDAPFSEGARYGAIGGALMQSCRVAGAIEQMAYSYDLSDFSRELLIAASFIANSGKIIAFDLVDHVPVSTIKGSLYGDSALSYQRIILSIVKLKQDPKKAIELAGVSDDKWNLDEDVILQLTHLILSSRNGGVDAGNKDEKLGAVLPQSLEAMILSQCFLSDERAAATYDAIKAMEVSNPDPNDPFTPYDFHTRRKFLKPGWFDL